MEFFVILHPKKFLEYMCKIRNFKREKALQHDMSPEQLYDLVAGEIDAIYANG